MSVALSHDVIAERAALGDAVYSKFPFVDGMRPAADDLAELVLKELFTSLRPTESDVRARAAALMRNASIRYQALCRRMEERLLKYHRFRQKVVEDAMGALWVDDVPQGNADAQAQLAAWGLVDGIGDILEQSDPAVFSQRSIEGFEKIAHSIMHKEENERHKEELAAALSDPNAPKPADAPKPQPANAQPTTPEQAMKQGLKLA